MMDEERRKSSETEDWIKELLCPDFKADMRIGGVFLPSHGGLSNHIQQNIGIAPIMTSNNNPSMWQPPHCTSGSLPTMFHEFSQNRTSSNMVSNLNQQHLLQNQTSSNMVSNLNQQHLLQNQTSSNMVSNLNQQHLLQNRAVEQRQGVYPMPMQSKMPIQSNPYPSNLRPHRQVQVSPGCNLTNFMARHQERVNVLQHNDQGQSGLVPERAHQELQMSGFHQAQNVTLNDQLKPANQSQTTRLGPLPESTPQPELNSNEWVDHAYSKILQMKEAFTSELFNFNKKALEWKNSTNNPEALSRYEKIRIQTEKAINFLNMSRSDIFRCKKERVYQIMNDVLKYANQVKARNSHVQKQTQQVDANNTFQFNSTQQQPSSTVQNSGPINPMRSNVQSNHIQTGFDQRALRMFVNPTQGNNPAVVSSSSNVFGQSDHSVNLKAQQNKQQQQQQQYDHAVKRLKNKQQIVQKEKNPKRFTGINQRWSPISPCTNSPQNSQQSNSQIEWKDLSPSFSKSATQTQSLSASQPAIASSPLTPCSKPSTDIAKSPLSSLDESNKFPQNRTVFDAQAVTNSGVNKEVTEKSTSCAEGEYPVKRLIEVVKSMSSTALSSAIQDMDDVTTLTDRIARNFLHGDSTLAVFRDLADDISDFRTESKTKDQLETTSFMETEMGYASGSTMKIHREPRDLLLQEIREINQRYMEVKVDVMNSENVSTMGSVESIIIRCSYVPVGTASQLMMFKLILDFIVMADYPNISPTVSENFPPGCGSDSEEGKNMWMKAKSSFSLRLRKFSQPVSVKQMASAWEVSAREVFIKYAEQMGAGSCFSSVYGNWINFSGDV